MTKWGIRCVLVRDMTDSMYDPKASPFVAHERGTALVIEARGGPPLRTESTYSILPEAQIIGPIYWRMQ